jgi:hypothetical protein
MFYRVFPKSGLTLDGLINLLRRYMAGFYQSMRDDGNSALEEIQNPITNTLERNTQFIDTTPQIIGLWPP